MNSADLARAGFSGLAIVAGLIIAINAAPGPAFDANTTWAAIVKISQGYLAYVGLNSSLTTGAEIVSRSRAPTA